MMTSAPVANVASNRYIILFQRVCATQYNNHKYTKLDSSTIP